MRYSAAPTGKISIHVPLAGDDHGARCISNRSRISIHVPLAGDDTSRKAMRFISTEFLSTSPLRGTTAVPVQAFQGGDNFYPRPPCGGRHLYAAGRENLRDFYPRPPCGGRRRAQRCTARKGSISIHVPLAGDDQVHPVVDVQRAGISIHVPLAGDDVQRLTCQTSDFDFYPRPPCGGRRMAGAGAIRRMGDFYPRPPCGGRHSGLRDCYGHSHFYPRPPCGGRR